MSSPATGRRTARVERKPRVAVAVTVLFFAWLYLPIAAVVLFSFNDVKSLATFRGFSTQWYSAFFADQSLVDSLWASLGIASVAALGSLVLGTMLALAWSGSARAPAAWSEP